MKLTKYEHACLVIEKDGEQLVIDPGVMTKLPDLTHVTAVVITHVHADHLSAALLKKLVADNPALTVYAADEVLAELDEFQVKKVAVQHDMIGHGAFSLEFFGHDHAVIYETVPCQNRGVLVNDWLYYPGDSFTVPEKPVEVLAVPASAPWMKLGEAIDFVKLVKPKRAFPTHNSLLSEFGESVVYPKLEQVVGEAGGTFEVLAPGKSLTNETI